MIGKPITSLVRASDRAELSERLATAARTDPRPQSRWDLVCASGEVRSLAWSTVRLTDKEDCYTGLVSIGADETDRLAAERDLERTRHELERLGRANMLGELVSALAHELNQPLAAILSNAQAASRFLDSDHLDPAELREIFDDIVQDDKRAGEVIQRLRLMVCMDNPELRRFPIQEPIRAENTAKGARFSFTLPMMELKQSGD
jgi:C4-dicarboxylate-specific signal transduction histidine kinase